jgi:hypothetical protein
MGAKEEDRDGIQRHFLDEGVDDFARIGHRHHDKERLQKPPKPQGADPIPAPPAPNTVTLLVVLARSDWGRA